MSAKTDETAEPAATDESTVTAATDETAEGQSSQTEIEFAIAEVADVIRARCAAREMSKRFGFGLADQVRFVTAVAELVQNALQHAGGGKMKIFDECNEKWNRLRVVVEDQGPGIKNFERILANDFCNERNALGTGLPGVKRLVTEFHIRSLPGRTCVEIALVRIRQGV